MTSATVSYKREVEPLFDELIEAFNDLNLNGDKKRVNEKANTFMDTYKKFILSIRTERYLKKVAVDQFAKEYNEDSKNYSDDYGLPLDALYKYVMHDIERERDMIKKALEMLDEVSEITPIAGIDKNKLRQVLNTSPSSDMSDEEEEEEEFEEWKLPPLREENKNERTYILSESVSLTDQTLYKEYDKLKRAELEYIVTPTSDNIEKYDQVYKSLRVQLNQVDKGPLMTSLTSLFAGMIRKPSMPSSRTAMEIQQRAEESQERVDKAVFLKWADEIANIEEGEPAEKQSRMTNQEELNIKKL
jgi:flagellin-specific chaperone FliS